MLDFIVLTESLLIKKHGFDTKISSRVITHRDDICVIYAISQRASATVIWDTHNTHEPLHIHISHLDSSISITAELRSIDGKRWQVSADSAIYARSSGRYITVITLGGDEIVCAMNFAQLETLFPNIFTRIHRSYAVNFEYVAELKYDSVILKNTLALPLSRKCAESARRAFITERYKT